MSAIERLRNPDADRAARIDLPRRMTEILYEANAITRREFDAADFVQLQHERLMRGRDPVASSVLQLLRDDLKRLGLTTWDLVRRVCLEHENPELIEDQKKLRTALQMIAVNIDLLAKQHTGSAGIA
jgi:hypothetical protein